MIDELATPRRARPIAPAQPQHPVLRVIRCLHGTVNHHASRAAHDFIGRSIGSI
jgi:hypothetical protein